MEVSEKYSVEEYDRLAIARLPQIPWRTPLPIYRISDGVGGFACRFCIGRLGVKGKNIDELMGVFIFRTLTQFEQHLEEHHPCG